MSTIFKNKHFRNHFSTVMGLLVAIANAWMTIDWTTFDWKRDYMKLVLSGVIAVGGWVTQIRLKDNGNKVDTPS